MKAHLIPHDRIEKWYRFGVTCTLVKESEALSRVNEAQLLFYEKVDWTRETNRD